MFDAAENGDVEFISQRLSVPVSRFREPGTGRTLLHAACYAAQVEVVKYLLEDNVVRFSMSSFHEKIVANVKHPNIKLMTLLM